MRLSVAILFVGFIVVTSGTPFPFRSRRSTEETNYFVLVDAGSTSSKLKVYSWSPSASPESLPVVTLVSSTKFKPGLSSFEEHLDEVESYMDRIVNAAKRVVPVDQQNETLFVVMATSGLRFYSASTSKAIMTKVQEFLSDETFSPFRYAQDDVQILSGEEEAVYSWLALNYLAGYFQGDIAEPYGSLELGGGSTQIAFIPHEPIYNGEFQVTLNSRLYQLYAQSYLDFGGDGINRQIVARLLDYKDPGDEPLSNPCLLKGDVKIIELEDGRKVVSKGVGGPDQCLKVLRDILKPATGIACQPKPCALGTVYQPSVANVTFYAMSAFKYAPETLNAIRPDDSIDLEKMLSAARSGFCAGNIQDVTDDEGGPAMASNNCMNGLYIATLFHTSYGFDMDTTNIRMGKDFGGESIDWALGAAVMEISRGLGSNPSVKRK